MTDQEITELCARAKGDVFAVVPPIWSEEGLWCFPDGASDSDGFWYHPLQDDAQAMALVKRLEISIDNPHRCDASLWRASMFGSEATDKNLNRAICLCAAKVQKEKETQ